jgi:hypothetical protein
MLNNKNTTLGIILFIIAMIVLAFLIKAIKDEHAIGNQSPTISSINGVIAPEYKEKRYYTLHHRDSTIVVDRVVFTRIYACGDCINTWLNTTEALCIDIKAGTTTHLTIYVEMNSRNNRENKTPAPDK